MVFVVDTNILLYAVDRDSPDHEKCRAHLEAWRRQSSPWHVTWGIVYEFLRVATHPNVFRKPFTLSQAWSFVEAVMASPSMTALIATDRHEQVAAEVFAEIPDIRGNLVFDARTAILMREHGIKTIYTRDADFNRFPFLDVVDPVQEHRRTTASRRRPKGRG
jgi:toxin-antitoxin system PIN domain toxin